MGIVNMVMLECNECSREFAKEGNPVDVIIQMAGDEGWHINEEEVFCPDCLPKEDTKHVSTLIEILSKHCVHFDIRCKRLDGEFVGRNCWEILDINGDSIKECEWHGFATAEECVADLIKTMKEVQFEY